MNGRIERNGLYFDTGLEDFIVSQALPGTDIDAESFFAAFGKAVRTLTPINKRLIEKREFLQRSIDEHYRQLRGQPFDAAQEKAFLEEIGYIVPEGEDFTITTTNVDDEIALIPGPQLVVPVTNARYALNAANARWGSLYDALYGTDAISRDTDSAKPKDYDSKRGNKVIEWGRSFLDRTVPLKDASHIEATLYCVVDGELTVQLLGGRQTTLKNRSQFAGYRGKLHEPTAILFCNNRLHIEVCIDHDNPIGMSDTAGIADIMLESAVSTIMDCEDSVATIDAEDKITAYRNWLGLMKGDLAETFQKGALSLTRSLAADRTYMAPDGSPLSLHGRSLMLIRNVGHLMTTPAVLDGEGNEIYEGLLDAFMTALIALHDLNKTAGLRNSRKGSIYIVKPKMHGPEEVAFADTLFACVEDALSLPRHTLKIGIMDEERRTSVNLKECIRAAMHRLAFINTGFLDRTGDEIHTAMEAGPMLRKGAMKSTSWLAAYEQRNVAIGLACGLSGKAQIGKGMWAMPDRMADMLATKIDHLKAGATCAWVPSPTAATLHATHYHRIDVLSLQQAMQGTVPASLEQILTLPLAIGRNWNEEEIRIELENNAQGILGYVVRWIEQGIGCSKVPDINNVGLMEDRATLRISSQHIANWLLHGVTSEQEVMDVLKKMATIVDAQNAGDPAYKPMMPDHGNSPAFSAASALIFNGREQPSGYTEPLLHACRKKVKDTLAA